MSEAVRVYIERIKAALQVVTDEEMAVKIGYSKQAIANWRRRNIIPKKAELRIIGILGNGFAMNGDLVSIKRMNYDDIVHGLAILAVEQYTSHWRRPLRLFQVRAIGRRFDELEAIIRKFVDIYADSSCTQQQVIAIGIRAIEKELDPRIHELLSVFRDDGFLQNEA